MHTGAPCLYYGTENFTEGGYDPDCRRTMDWDEGKQNIRSLLGVLSALRQCPEIERGEIAFSSENGLFVLERKADGILRLTVNNTKKSAPVRVRGEIAASHKFADNTLAAGGFVIQRISE